MAGFQDAVFRGPLDASIAIAPTGPDTHGDPGAQDPIFQSLKSAITGRETDGNKNPSTAVSPQGARGKMQIMPDTFAQYAKPGESFDNEDHRVAAATRKLWDDYNRFGGDIDKTAGAYIGGPGAIGADGTISDTRHDAFGTTPRAYARQVKARMGLSGSGGGGGTAPGDAGSNDFQDATFLGPVNPPSPAASESPEQDQPGIVSDTGNLLGQGSAQTVQGISYALNKVTGGASDRLSEHLLGRSLTDISGDVADHYMNKLSPEMQAAAKKEWITDGGAGEALTDPRSYYAGIINSLPATIATMGPAGWSAKFAATAAANASLAKSAGLKLSVAAAKEAADKAAIKAATYAAIIAGGGGEGLIGGGQQGKQTEDAIRALKPDVLMQAEPYRRALAEAKAAGLSDAAAHKQAVDKVAGDAGMQTLWQVGVATAVLGAGFDGFVGARIAKVMGHGTAEEMSRLKAGLHGAAVEVPTELSQGFAEQYLGNVAERDNANPAKDVMEGVANNAVGSGLSALPMGFGFGAATGGGGHPPAQTPPGAPPAPITGTGASPTQPPPAPVDASAPPGNPNGGAESAPAAPATAPNPRVDAEPPPTTAADVDKAAEVTNPNPTEAQKKSGKYDKGIVDLHGLEVHIESAKGNERSGTDATGRAWSVTMANHYGEIFMAKGEDGVYRAAPDGADGDKVDVFIGPHPELKTVYVVNQNDPNTGKFDEHKAMLGFDSLKAAKDAYMANFEGGWKGFGSITPLGMNAFKARLHEFSKAEAIKKHAPAAVEKEPAIHAAKPQGGAIIPKGNTTQPPAVTPAPEPVQKPAPSTKREQPPKANDDRATRLESIAQTYDSIGATERAANVRRRAAAPKQAGENIDAMQRVANTEKTRHDLANKSKKPTQQPAKESAEKPAEKPQTVEPKEETSATQPDKGPAAASESAGNNDTKPQQPDKTTEKTEQAGQPVKKLTPKEQAQADVDEALADLGRLMLSANSLKVVPDFDEKKLIPVLTNLMDAAFRLGYHKFKDAAKYALQTIRKALGADAVKAITLDHLQGAYIGMAGKYRDQGADGIKEVSAVESLTDIEGEKNELLAGQEQPGSAGPKPLENVSAPEIPATGGKPATDPGTGSGGGPDTGSNGGRPASGVQPTGSVGNGAPEIPAAAGGTKPTGAKPAEPGVRQPGGNEPGTRSDPRGGGPSLKPEPTPAPTPGAPFPVAKNFVITDELNLGAGTPTEKYKGNVAAIKLLKQIEGENRTATPAEQKVLARYVGWGGIKQAFPRPGAKPAQGWEGRVNEVRALLTPEEHDAAARSILDAHYTSKTVIDAMWNAARRLGFDGGRVLENSMGVGNFFGLMPADLRVGAPLTGIEKDSITARIAKQLYPEANIHGPIGFEDVNLADNTFNLTIGNPPFGNQSLYDALSKHLKGWSIHNFFFGKAIDKLAPGGIHIQVVSRFLMDKEDPTTRDYLAHRTELISAIRLPWTAFSENANTQVVTDILIFQKLPEDKWGTSSKAWTQTVKVADPLGHDPMTVNSYFAANPDNILGVMNRSGEMQREHDITVQPHDHETIEQGLQRIIDTLPQGIYHRGKPATAVRNEHAAAVSPADVIEGYDLNSYFIDNGKVMQRVESDDGSPRANEIAEGTQWSEKRTLGPKRLAQLKGMIGIKLATRETLQLQKTDAPAAEIKASIDKLNKLYDAFVKEHGYLNSDANERLFKADPDAPLLLALEHKYDRGISKDRAKTLGVPARAPYAEKMPILTQRVVNPYIVPTHADTVSDGLAVSISEKGIISVPYIVSLTGKSEAEVIEGLTDGEKPEAYLDPESNTYKLASEYLGGNVKAKYAAAKRAGLTANAEALHAVFPPDVKSGDIRARLGSAWIARGDYEAFVKHLFSDSAEGTIQFIPATGGYAVHIEGGDPTLLNTKWGTPDRPGHELLSRVLNNRDLTVRRRDSNGDSYVDVDATQAANDKADEIRNEFESWIFKDVDRRERLVKFYNDNMNTSIESRYDGDYLTLPGKVPDAVIKLRRHQKDAVARVLRTGKILYDHVVGAGKTFTIIAATMEQRRLGMANKPMIVVPNHLVAQWATDFYRLYPGAKILAMRKSDFAKDKRQKMLARVATGDWDAVIFSHSSFGFIDNDREVLKAALDKQVAEIQAAIDIARETEGKTSRTAAAYQKTKEKIQQRLKALSDAPKDKLLTFQELGVDMLNVDESQEFKNLFFTTQRMNVGGFGNKNGSKKAFGMFIKTQWLQDKQDGRGVGFATGTPISNSLTELFTLQRYLGMKELEQRGMTSLDSWLASFGIVESQFESNVTGTQYKRKERLRRITNAPEIVQLYKQFTDSVTLDDIKQNYRNDNNGAEFPVPTVKGHPKSRENIVVPRSEAQAAFSVLLQERMDNLTSDQKKDNALAILGAGRKAALDMRLVDRSAADDPGSKVNRAAAEIAQIYNENDHRAGTQLVFLDLSTPNKHGKRDAEAYLKQARKLLDNPNAAPYGNFATQWANLRELLNEKRDSIDESNSANEDELAALDKFMEDEAEIQAAVDTVDSGFSVYDELRRKLNERGVPDSQIAFIHDYNGDAKKQELFDMVNAGTIRVLMGSTAKMGAGTNVQQRLVALHHMDAPWRPSDIEQREGRIIRQGNLFREADPKFEVAIKAYATEGTSDTFFWQTLEQKLIGINSLRNYAGEREIEEVSMDAMSAAEMKALASGNPLILEDVSLTEAVRKMEAQRRRHNANNQDIESEIKKYRNYLDRLPALIDEQTAFMDKVSAYKENPFEGATRPTGDIDGQQMNSSQAMAYAKGKMREAEEAARIANAPIVQQITEVENESRIAPKASARRLELEEQWTALNKSKQKATISVKFNGVEYKTLDTLRKHVEAELGDDPPVRMVIDGKEMVRDADIANALQPIVARMVKSGDGTETVGTIGGMDIVIDGSDKGVEVHVGGQVTFVDTRAIHLLDDGKREDPPTGARVVAAIPKLFNEIRSALQENKRRLKEAQTGLKPLEEQAGGAWGKDDELAAKKARLAQVRNELASGSPAAPAADPGPVMSTAGRGKPESEWLSTAKITQIVQDRTEKFAHQVPVMIVDRPSDVNPGFTDGSMKGMVWNSRIYLFRDALDDDADVVQTLWHELLHYGIRRFMTIEQYYKTMAELYSADYLMRERANSFAGSKQGQALLDAGYGPDYIIARGVDEGLAELAQLGEAQFKDTKVVNAARAVIRWLAKLADRLGFTVVAQGLRSIPQEDARSLIHSMFAKLKNDAPAAAGWFEHSDPAFSLVEKAAGEPGAYSASPIGQRVTDLFKAITKNSNKLTLWDRTIGTMFNMAQKNPAFRRVFNKGQDYLADVWRYATQADQAAQTWFKRGWWQGFDRKAGNAVSPFLFHGTLNKKIWSDKELREGVTVEDSDGKHKLPGLNDKQVKMYHEALAAVRVAAENMAKGIIAKAAKSDKMKVRIDKNLNLEDLTASVREQITDRIASTRFTIKTLSDAQPHNWLEQVVALKKNVETDLASINHISRIENETEKGLREGYFPLSRFGSHHVTVYQTELQKDRGDPIWFSLHESETAANLEEIKQRRKHPGAHSVTTGKMSQLSHHLYDGVNLDSLEQFAKHIGLDKDETFQQAYQELFSSRSTMKRLIHRKGTLGYSTDAYRTLADFIMSTSRTTSATQNFPAMLDGIQAIHDGDVKDHAMRLYDYLRNPVEEAHKMRSYLFFHFIGGSMSSALVNLTQTALVTAPFLTTHADPATVSARIIGAGKSATLDPFAKKGERFVNDGKLWDDVRKATEDGILAPQEIFQMIGVAAGSKLAGNKLSETFLQGWGAMFGYAETFNRRIAYIAAHNIATAKGIKAINEDVRKEWAAKGNEGAAPTFANAHEFAEDAVKQTQFLYNKGNRPHWGRGPLGSTVLTFKQFSINTLELLGRMPLQQKIYMIVMLLLLAGVEGLPFAEDLENLIDTIGQRFPETGLTTNSKKWLDRNMQKIFGQFYGNALVQGMLSTATGADVSQKLSLGHLIPGSASLKVSETDKVRDIVEVLGPAAGLAKNIVEGAGDLLRGNLTSAAKKALPVAASNLLKGAEMLATGEARDSHGQFVAKVDVLESIAKLTGLNPNVIADYQRAQQKIKTDENYITVTKSALMDQFIDALMHNRPDDLERVRKQIQDWNKAHPELPIILSPSAVRERLKLAAMDPNARQIKLAPKALRAEVAREQRE